MSFNILLAHTPGKASSVDFLSPLQTDRNLTLQMKLTDHVPVFEIEIETEAKAPDVSPSNISEIATFSEEVDSVVYEVFITQLKAHGLYYQFLTKQHSGSPDINITGVYTFSSISQVNLFETNDSGEFLKNSPNRAEPVDLVHEQQTDKIVREVISWENWGHPDGSSNLPIALTK